MRGHKGLDLYVLLLVKQFLHNLNVTVLGIPHQDQVSCQPFLHSTLGVLANPLEISANLERKTTVTCLSLDFRTLHSMTLGN